MSDYGDSHIIKLFYWLLLELISSSQWVSRASPDYPVGQNIDSRYKLVSTQRIWINITQINQVDGYWRGISLASQRASIISGLVPFKTKTIKEAKLEGLVAQLDEISALYNTRIIQYTMARSFPTVSIFFTQQKRNISPTHTYLQKTCSYGLSHS
jgi:hypothetical protein